MPFAAPTLCAEATALREGCQLQLSEIFAAVVHKRLAAVDLPGGSHQHEMNGSVALKEFFGTSDRTAGTLHWHYFSDDDDPIGEEDTFTFYDAREKSADRTHRSEWRLYYHSNFIARALPDDVLIVVRVRTEATEEIHGLVFAMDSAWLRAAAELFGLQSIVPSLRAVPEDQLSSHNLELTEQLIIDELGIPVAIPPSEADSEIVTRQFGDVFPTTRLMSAFARKHVDVDPANADETLMRWITREDQLFRALERQIVGQRIDHGLGSVDDYIQYFLSVHNRRKSRMGHALENQLEELFRIRGLHFERNRITEGRNSPDFLFPGSGAYRDPTFDAGRLVMLAAKSTCKDRWRQILTEAERIPVKHLCTLEPGISTSQTDEMKQQRVALVIPQDLLETYSDQQRYEIMNLNEFIGFIQVLQSQ